MTAAKKLIRYEDVYRYAFAGANGGGLEDEDFDAIVNAIESVPAVDAVEVVRCKDCKHRADLLDCGNYLCNKKMLGMVRPIDFCSFGERKDREGK